MKKEKIPIIEIIRRIVLIVTTSFFFEMPGLKSLRNTILRLFFKFGPHTSFKMGAKMVLIHPNPQIRQTINIGDYCEIGVECMLDYSGGIIIGNDVWISQNVKIFTHIHPVDGDTLKREREITFHPVNIEDDAWLGSSALILPTVNTIGKGAVVGAGSVVSKDVAQYDIVAGNPAKVIGSRLRSQSKAEGMGAG